MTSGGREASPKTRAKRALDEALFVVRSNRDRDRRWKSAAGKALARTLVKRLLEAKAKVMRDGSLETAKAAMAVAAGAELASSERNYAFEIEAGIRTGNPSRTLFHARKLEAVRERLGAARLDGVAPLGPEIPAGADDEAVLAVCEAWAGGAE